MLDSRYPGWILAVHQSALSPPEEVLHLTNRV